MKSASAGHCAALFAAFVASLFPADRQPEVPARPVWTGEGVTHFGTPAGDGRLLSCVDTSTGDLAVRDLKTGEMRRLTKKHPKRNKGEFAYFSTISPDSKRVAYAWFNDEKFYDLRIVGMDGSEPRVLFRNPEAGFVQPCSWSPDGKQILTLFFRKDNISQVALVSADDGSVRVLKSLSWFYPKKMDFSPDGQYIVYDNLERPGAPQRDIMLLAADGSREVRLVQSPANDLYPLWAPDGKSVLFLSDRKGSLDIWIVNVADGEAKGEPAPLVRGFGRILPMGITREGGYYFGLRTGMTDIYVAAVDLKAASVKGKPVLASPHYRGVNTAPDWAPDGERIAFLSVRGSENYGQETRVLSIRQLKTGEERDLHTRMSYIERFHWSPDGKSLLVSGSDRRGRAGLFQLDVETGREAVIASDDSASFRGLEGVWSPAGGIVYYIDGNTLYAYSVETRKSTEVYRQGPPLFYPTISPDGKRLALATKNGQVLVLPLTAAMMASEPEEVTIPAKGHLRGLAWAVDGERLLMTIGQEESETVWVVPFHGSQANELDLPKELRAPVCVHPDGDRLAFTVGSPKDEIWVVENILSYRQAP